MAINNCTPGNVYGDIDHTLFLGCSVKGFSCNIGWSEQVSEVTISLVQDPCEAPAERPKHYWNTSLSEQTTTAADPGFLGEVANIIGIPVYFRFGEFEFCGLVQSWEKTRSQSAFPIYTVKIVSPVAILNNTNLILDGYTGPISPDTLFALSPHNLINVYGFVEGVDGVSCPELYQSDEGVYDFGDDGVDGAVFGTAAGAFGGAGKNNNGIRWSLIQNVVSVLTSSIPAVKNSWSPHGRLTHKGLDLSDGGSPWTNGYGVLEYDAVINFNNVSQYFLDLSSLPSVPAYFRFSGHSISLLEAITRVCQESGHDYFIELVPIINGNNVYKIIKIRTVSRVVQPDLTAVQDFISEKESTDTLIDSSYGHEFRDDTTSAFLYGGPKETIYQTYQSCNPEGLTEAQLNQFPSGELDMILPFYGLDSYGNMIVPQRPLFFGDNGEWCHEDTRFVAYEVSLETDLLNNNLGWINFSGAYLRVGPGEFNAALISFEEWETRTTSHLFGGDISHSRQIINSFSPNGQIVEAEKNWNKIGEQIEALQDNIDAAVGVRGLRVDDLIICRDNLVELRREADIVADNVQHVFHADIIKIYEFIRNIAEQYHGKAWAVRVPYTCGFLDTESNTVFYSDEPGQNGGWTEVPTVLSLPNPGDELSFFTNKQNKIFPFLQFNINDVVSSYLVSDNSIISDGKIYIRCEMQPEYVFHNKETLYLPRIVVELPEPMTEKVGTILEDIGGIDTLLQLMDMPEDKRKDILNNLGTTVGEKSAFYRQFVVADAPQAAALPIKSNVHSYGPWSVVGSPGGIKVEQDDGLVPWEYGGYTAMDAAGNELVQAGLTNMQVGEVGSVTVAGYPTLPLGAELNSANILNGTNLVETRTSDFGFYNGSFGGNPFAYQFLITDGVELVGNYGPSITSIDINIGDSITTTYTMRTFTPKFGRFSELNASRLRQIGQQRLELLKRINDFDRQNSLGGVAGFNRNILQDRLSSVVKKSAKLRKRDVAQTPHSVFVGEIYTPVVNTGFNGSGFYSGTNNIGRTLVNSYSSHDIVNALAAYEKKSYMSMDGLIRPVSMAGGGGLPRYVNATGNTTSTTNQTYLLTTGLEVTGLASGVTTSLVTIRDLNPFANPTGYAWSELASQHVGTAGHDIDMVGRGTGIPSGGILMPFNGTGVDYADDYRMFALRGPLLLQSWGRNTEGNPIPNESDTEGACLSGIFQTTGLSDRFLPDWLQKSHTWPVAPVDLRLDIGRGVWTLNNNEIEVYGQLLSHLGNNRPGTVLLLDSGTIYRDSGTSGNITGYSAISGWTTTHNVYASGCKLKFKYSQSFARWEVSSDSHLTVLLTGVISGATWDRNITGFKPFHTILPLFTPYMYLNPSTGESGNSGNAWMSYETGNLVHVWNKYTETISPGAGQAYISNVVNGWLENADCNLVTL